MATVTPNFNWPVPTSTDLVKDGATAIEALGDSIDASLLDLKGGTSGQVLAKNSNTDMDFIWVAQDDSNAIQNAIVDAKGDLIAATAADTPARLPVGANGTILTADSAQATGLKWATPAAAGGKVLQVVGATTGTFVQILTTTYTDSGITATITPTSASSKILVMIAASSLTVGSGGVAESGVRLQRDATTVLTIGTNKNAWTNLNIIGGAADHVGMVAPIIYLDSPATTSSITYKLQGALRTAGGTSELNFQWNTSNTTSTITLMEIGA